MIRYFTNYSYGGYEELYLGNSEDKEKYRYHLPLLQSKKARLADDPTNKKLADDVERLSKYDLIQKNGVTPIGTLPEESFTIISNPGYKTICRKLGSQFVVAISDVASEDHDEMGGGKRENPFTMLFVFNMDDANLMDAFLFQLLEKENEWRSFISRLFIYDPIANGLRFSLGELNDAIKKLETIRVSGIDHHADVPLMVLEENFKLAYSLKVQRLEGASLGIVYNAEGEQLRGSGLSATKVAEQVPPLIGERETELKNSSREVTPVSGNDVGELQLPNLIQDTSKDEMIKELRSAIRKEEREKADKEIRQDYQKKMDLKEIGFNAEKKKLIYMAIGAAIGAFIIGALLFK